jgi:hypothetical protein
MSVRVDTDPLFLAFQLAVAGRYSIDREIGRGGMGVVYLAREVHLDRSVAIKLLPPDRAKDPALRARFLREARLAAKLSHPNIIPIHSVDETGDFVYFVMAFVDGETLAHRVRTRGPLPSGEGARVLREVAWALAYAHGQGVVHRDVKPDNILLEASSGRVLVADFGIAAAVDDHGADGIVGTPEFMSPEQALGGEMDARSDLYSLGATAFFAFSGRLAFEGQSATEILAKQVTAPAPPLGSVGTTVPKKIAVLVDRCLAKEPDLRPASAQALAEQLGVALEQRRESPVALRAFVKRNARLDGTGTIFTGVAVTGVSAYMAGTYQDPFVGLATLLVGATALPFTHCVREARRLLLSGFAHSDLERPFATEMELVREELAVAYPDSPVALEKTLPSVTRGALVVFVSIWSWLALFDQRGPTRGYALAGLALSGITALMSSLATMGLARRHRDVSTEFWAKVWTGRVGKAAFAVARRFLGNRPVATAMTHRATELSLGMAAEQLYESLPKEMRRALGDLPEVLRWLQRDAQVLRRNYEELQEALADAGDAAASDRYAEVRATRDSMHAKLRDAVSALETIRLNLLRLHAGSGTVEGLTTHLGLAADVSMEVERLVAAHSEVETLMRFPRETVATPS